MANNRRLLLVSTILASIFVNFAVQAQPADQVRRQLDQARSECRQAHVARSQQCERFGFTSSQCTTATATRQAVCENYEHQGEQAVAAGIFYPPPPPPPPPDPPENLRPCYTGIVLDVDANATALTSAQQEAAAQFAQKYLDPSLNSVCPAAQKYVLVAVASSGSNQAAAQARAALVARELASRGIAPRSIQMRVWDSFADQDIRGGRAYYYLGSGVPIRDDGVWVTAFIVGRDQPPYVHFQDAPITLEDRSR